MAKEAGKAAESSQAEAKDGAQLLCWHELPPWQQDNQYIVSGYRPLSYSYQKSLASLGSLHNQTVNIYSHLLGLVVFVVAARGVWDALAERYVSASHEDLVVFGCFFGGAFLCFAFSTAFHTFSNHSLDAHERWLFMDFLGILCLTAGSWIPGVYYGYYCRPTTYRFYVFMISTIATACAALIITPRCRTQEWAKLRTTMFISLGLVGVIPMTFAAQEFGIAQAHRQMGWCWIALEGLFYACGAAVYASKYPEKLWPGAFDIVGSSHQIFHVLVICGALAHLTAILQAFDYNHHPETRMCRIA